MTALLDKLDTSDEVARQSLTSPQPASTVLCENQPVHSYETQPEAATSYTTSGYAITPLWAKSKSPTRKEWQKPAQSITNPAEARDYYEQHPDQGIGLVHVANRTAALDVDDYQLAKKYFAERGLDLDQILASAQFVIQTPKSRKAFFRLPPGQFQSIKYTEDSKTVFELRCGDCHDVLPPSIHPTGVRYVHITPVPSLADLEFVPDWWFSFIDELKASKPKVSNAANGARSNSGIHKKVIKAFNQKYTCAERLERNGYEQDGDRWRSRDSTSNAGIVVLRAKNGSERVFCHHAGDPLYSDKGHDAFSLFCTLEHGNVYLEAIEAAAKMLGINISSTKGKGKQKVSELVVEMMMDLNPLLVSDSRGNAYIVTDQEEKRLVLQAPSSELSEFAGRLLYRERGIVAPMSALSDAARQLKAMAKYDGEKHEVYVRVARVDQTVYIDLCNDEYEVVKVDASGVRIISAQDCPVYFVRPKGAKSLPRPTLNDADIGLLDEFLNIGKTHFILLVSFLVYILMGRAPYPILALFGEHGSGKSTLARFIHALIDPHQMALQTPPKSERDLFIIASSLFLYIIDNASHLSADISDAYCRMCTGATFATRALFTDTDQVVLNIARPIMINGIPDLLSRPDLADRAIKISSKRIAADERRSSSKLEQEFKQAEPSIFTGLLKAVSAALKHLNDVHLEELLRLADFARAISAAELEDGVLPWKPGEFIRAYKENAMDMALSVLEGDGVVRGLRGLWDVIFGRDFKWREARIRQIPRAEEYLNLGYEVWVGTATQLLSDGNFLTHRYVTSNKFNAKSLSGSLRRLAPVLEQFGLHIEFFEHGNTSERRQILIYKDPETSTF
jgi:energy-coupling factor transporter ATP-binding protein EcfA2